MIRAVRLLLGDRSAAAAIEFAIISVPLVVLTIGIVDFGRTLYTRNNMAHAGDIGARMILIDGQAADATVTATIRDAFIAGPSGDLGVILGTASQSGISFRTIDLSYQIDLLTPLLAVGEITLSHSRRVPVE